MTADTPYQWLSLVARDDPDRVCVVDGAHAMSYSDVLARVDERAADMDPLSSNGEIVPVRVSLDAESVIEILAVGHAGGAPLPFTDLPPDRSAVAAPNVAVCIRTSGTSGLPKVVPLSFANVAASVAASRARLGNGPEDRWLLCLPLDHVGGVSIIWRTLEAGGSLVVAPFSAVGETIERYEPTIASMVPTMVQRLMDSNQTALASIGLVLVGGAPISTVLWQRCIESDVHLVSTYGMTEAGSQIATALPTDASMRGGLPLDGFDVVILNRDGEPASAGETGVISVDGPAVFDGYLREPPRQGPFRTSDLGRLDADGRLHVEGRADDVIISGGVNVSLGAVAAEIMRVDEVRDVCVVSVTDDEWGEIGCAMVVAAVPLDVVSVRVEQRMKAYERPKRWLHRDSIPEMPNGKHDVAAVRRAFEEDQWT